MAPGKASADLPVRTAIQLGAAALALGWSGAAWGQATATVSTSESVVFNPATTVTNASTASSTQIVGQINGGIVLFDQTFPVPFGDPLAQSGVVAARAAITTAGGPGVIIGAPVLSRSSTSTSSSSTTIYSLASTSQVNRITTAEIYVGPASFQAGTRSQCTGVSTLPGTTRPSCANVAPSATLTLGGSLTQFNGTTPTTINVQAGAIATNADVLTTYTIDQTTTVTTTTTVFEQYTLNGIVRRIGSVHALAADAGGEAAGLFSQRLRQAGDGELRRGLWLTGYGFSGRRSTQGEIAADHRSGEGVTGGFAARLGSGWSGGIGFDAGRTRLTLPVVGESGTVDLVQAGAHLGYDAGPFSLRLSGAHGRGHIATATAPGDFAFATSARYGLSTTSLSGEAGYAIPLGEWRLTPSLGGEWRRMSTERLTEPGTFGLAAAANGSDLARDWAGLALDRPVGKGALRVYGRATVQGHDRVILPVTFTTLGGAMQLESADYSGLGGEAGAALALPIAQGAWLYAAYDGRFHGGLALHSASGGIRLVF